jgi:hypothetical protein
MWVLGEEGENGRGGEGEILLAETYPITRYLVRMEVVVGVVRKGMRRFGLEELKDLAVPAPHRRVLRRLLGTA